MEETVIEQRQHKQKILIADDSEMNRDLLCAILEDEYEIIEVKDGVQAVDYIQKHAEDLSLILLDLVMPLMDGFEVLAYMNREHWIENIPVVIISSEDSTDFIKRGYELGVTDFIAKPFDSTLVRRRVTNAILLNVKQRRMLGIVRNQIYENEKSSRLMISILSHIVEFRNGESGLHVLHIQVITEMILRHLVQKDNNPFEIDPEQIGLITTASALHDIGKISIPDEILNKPGKLTAEEFTLMKGHSMAGANMLDQLSLDQKDEPLVKYAYEICRWHHERYDGGGYPDGLQGEEIPVSAQVVALADVYDALTSERCYKAAYSHEKAIDMILGGQCGTFHPVLLECLVEISQQLKKEMEQKGTSSLQTASMTNIASRFHDYEMESSEKIVQQLECERQRFEFLSEESDRIVFNYTVSPPILTLNKKGTERCGLRGPILAPLERANVLQELIEEKTLNRLFDKIKRATRENPTVVSDVRFLDGGTPQWYRCDCKVIWASEEAETYAEVIGRLIECDSDYQVVNEVMDRALSHSRSAEFSVFYDRYKEGGFAVSKEEAWILLQYLQISYDVVRLVNPETRRVLLVTKEGQITESGYCCYDVWNRSEGCENCISRRCVKSKERQMKLEVVGDTLYQVVSMYVEVDKMPCCMELVTKLTDDFMPQGYTREEILSSVRIHRKKKYIDRVTGVYNRRYFDEVLCKKEQVCAAALVDIVNFRKINESYGYQMGDDVLRRIAQELHEAIAVDGILVRYESDDFAFVFENLSEKRFYEILEDVRKRIRDLMLVELPGARFDLEIKKIYEKGTVQQLFQQLKF